MVIDYDEKNKCYYVETRAGYVDDVIVESERIYFDSEPKIVKYWNETNEHPDGMEYISYCILKASDGKTAMVKCFSWFPNVREGCQHTESWEVFALPYEDKRRNTIIMSQRQGQ